MAAMRRVTALTVPWSTLRSAAIAVQVAPRR
jgi:hypothetical protein